MVIYGIDFARTTTQDRRGPATRRFVSPEIAVQNKGEHGKEANGNQYRATQAQGHVALQA